MSAPETEPETPERLEFSALDGLRLLSAFQVLSLPSGMLGRGATHKRAREVIVALTGRKPKANPPRAADLTGYLAWHFDCAVTEADPEAVVAQVGRRS